MSAKMNGRNIGNPAIETPEFDARRLHIPNSSLSDFWAKRGQAPTNWNQRFGRTGFNKRRAGK